MLNFTTSLWIAFVVFAIGALSLFFSRTHTAILYSTSIVLTSAILNFLTGAFYLNDLHGKMIAIFIIITFLLQSLTVLYLIKKGPIQKLAPAFYIVPFMGFFLIATAQDLLSLIIGIEAFGACFYAFAYRGNRTESMRLITLKDGMLGLSALCLGLSLLYIRHGQVHMSSLQKAIQTQDANSLTIVGVGLITLGLIIKINSFIQTLRQRNGHL